MSANDKILALLSRKDTKENIEDSIKDLKEIYPEIAGLDYLAVAPSLHHRPKAVLILAILKKDAYIISSTIQESIEYLAECEGENKLYVLNSVDMERLYKNGTIDTEEYDRLKHCSIKLDKAFHAETTDELQKQFEENYKKHKTSKEKERIDESLQADSSLKDKQSWMTNYFEMPVRIGEGEQKKHVARFPKASKDEFQADEKRLGQVGKEDHGEERKISREIRILCGFEEDFPEEKHLSHLRKSANKHYQGVSKEDCKKMEDHLRFFHSDLVKADKNILLHLVIQKHVSRRGFSAGDVMAMIKYLFGVDPMTKATEKVKISFDPIVDNINLKDLFGRTALHKSAGSACGINYWLLRLKADPFILDYNGRIFLEYIPKHWKNVRSELELYLVRKKSQHQQHHQEIKSVGIAY